MVVPRELRWLEVESKLSVAAFKSDLVLEVRLKEARRRPRRVGDRSTESSVAPSEPLALFRK